MQSSNEPDKNRLLKGGKCPVGEKEERNNDQKNKNNEVETQEEGKVELYITYLILHFKLK